MTVEEANKKLVENHGETWIKIRTRTWSTGTVRYGYKCHTKIDNKWHWFKTVDEAFKAANDYLYTIDWAIT